MENLKRISERHDLPAKLREASGRYPPQTTSDPDFQLYTGGFFSDEDREQFLIIHRSSPQELLSLNLNCRDPRVPQMLWRFTCRNYPEILEGEDLKRWKSFAAGRILFPPGDTQMNLQFFRRKIAEKSQQTAISAADKLVLRKLADYADELEAYLFR
jgi:exodeoxyribonuclease I